MRINVDTWEKLHLHLSTAESGPPNAVYLLVNTLAAAAEIEDGYAESTSDDSSTTWRNWVVAKSSLVYTEVEFAAPNYDGAAEELGSGGNPNDNNVETDVHQAWVRRLDAVTSLNIGSVGRLSGTFRRDWYPIDGLSLTFADGTVVPLPGQTTVPINDRARSDQFLTAIQSRLPV